MGGAALIEILGLPIDIYNLVMTNSSNKYAIATGTWSLVLNWLFLAGNVVEIGAMGYLYFLLLSEKLNGVTDVIGPILMLAFLNVPGLVLLYNQINYFLYRAEIKKSGLVV